MRMGALIVGVIVIVGLPSAAWAEPSRAAEPTIAVQLGPTIWFPAGDIDEAANTSFGVRPTVFYRVHPAVAVVGTFDWIFVDEKSNSSAGDGEITYFAISAGVRLRRRLPSGLEPYGELLLGYHKLEADVVDDGSMGVRLGGGVMYPVASALLVSAGLAVSYVSIDTGFVVDVEVTAVVIDLGLGARF